VGERGQRWAERLELEVLPLYPVEPAPRPSLAGRMARATGAATARLVETGPRRQAHVLAARSAPGHGGLHGGSPTGRVVPRRVPLPPEDATAAFDRWVAAAGRLRRSHVVLTGPPPPGALDRDVLRAAAGRLAVVPGVHVRVWLAISPWSRRDVQLDVRPAGRAGRTAPIAGAWFRAAHGLLDELTAELVRLAGVPAPA